jgi:hypothetical protein
MATGKIFLDGALIYVNDDDLDLTVNPIKMKPGKKVETVGSASGCRRLYSRDTDQPSAGQSPERRRRTAMPAKARASSPA